jgi:hypothetical protein
MGKKKRVTEIVLENEDIKKPENKAPESVEIKKKEK